MAKTRKLRGGQLTNIVPPFETATPAVLSKLKKGLARDFITHVCKTKLPNYLTLFRRARGCNDKGCPTRKMTNAEQRWLDSEKEFTAQCLTAERLKKINPVPNSANLDPVYVKTTANWLIKNDKQGNAATAKAATAKAAANATAKAAAAPKTLSRGSAANEYTSSPSSLEQTIQKISKNLKSAQRLLTNVSNPTRGGSTRNVVT